MRYDFSRMSADSFELMVRSLNEKIFGVRCDQYGLGPDGQREFAFEGTVKEQTGISFEGRTIGQVKYKYVTTKEDDYKWLAREIDGELQRFRQKEADYIPDNYLFYTNVVLTPVKDTGVKDKIEAYVKEHNDIIKHFYVRGYDEICAMLDNNRDVAVSYAATILPGDLLVKLLEKYEQNYFDALKKYLFSEFGEEMYPRLEQAGSVVEKKIPIEKVCVDINVRSRQNGGTEKFAKAVFELGNGVLGYQKAEAQGKLDRNENFVLVGGPGKGKSTISQFIAQIYRAYDLQALGYQSQAVDEFMQEFVQSYGYRIDRIRIPFKVALREYAAWIRRKGAEENLSVLQYMRERFEKFEGDRLPMKTLRNMLSEQAWIFFFDGLDEVPESSNRKEVLQQIQLFLTMELKEARCDCMIIATTREQGYNNDFDEDKYTHMEVEEFSKKDSRKYAKKLFAVMEEQAQRREEYIRIMNEALEDETTSRLMKTPLQVTIIAILVKSGGKPPHERYSLFRQYYDTIVRREKQKGIVATLNDNTDWLEEIHYAVGYRLQSESEVEENASAEISSRELSRVIGDYVRENRDDFYEAKTKDADKVNEFLLTMTQRICFLSENREGFYSFTIRSMQEYFAGTYLVRGRSDKEAMENIGRIAYRSYWRNVLLFALGYLALERKSLEGEIGLLCERMNGKDNLVREDYTSDNLCLFGSWLAVDLLIEDIFRGKDQNKYIKLAAELIGFDECADYEKFSAIIGAQREKLVHYVREICGDDPGKVMKAVRLYLTLQENEKNHLAREIAEAMGKLTKEQALELDISILQDGIKYDKTIKSASLNRVKSAMERGEVKQFLPYGALKRILGSMDGTESMALKRNLLLQFLYFDYRRFKLEELQEKLGIACDMVKMFRYLVPMYRKAYWRNDVRIRLTESVEITLHDREIDREAVAEIQKELDRMGLEFLAGICGFLLNPTLAGYRELRGKLEEEEAYLAEKYRLVLEYYAGHEEARSEEEFLQKRTEREADCESLIKSDFGALVHKKTDIRFVYTCTHKKGVFDELMKSVKIPFDRMEILCGQLFGIYPFVAGIQVIYQEALSDGEDGLAEGLIRVVAEAERRKRYYTRENIVIGMLLGSKYKKDLWKMVPDFSQIEEMMDRELPYGYRSERSGKIRAEAAKRAIGSVVGKILCDGEENGYLALLPTLIQVPVDIRQCISENDRRELEKIEFTVGANLLAMKLLWMCMDENETPGRQIDEFLSYGVPRYYVYRELETMLRYCRVKNKEKFQVEMYLRLEKEDFAQSGEIRKRMLRDMMEDKYGGRIDTVQTYDIFREYYT